MEERILVQIDDVIEFEILVKEKTNSTKYTLIPVGEQWSASFRNIEVLSIIEKDSTFEIEWSVNKKDIGIEYSEYLRVLLNYIGRNRKISYYKEIE